MHGEIGEILHKIKCLTRRFPIFLFALLSFLLSRKGIVQMLIFGLDFFKFQELLPKLYFG